MNWGTKLVIGMGTFMAFIIILAIMMFNSKTDALVDNDYYEKGLNYDKTYAQKEQVQADNAAPGILISAESILLTFKTPATGTLKMVRNADKGMDRKLNIQTDPENRMVIPLRGLAKGRWRLILSWTAADKSYLYEKEVSF